MEWRSLWTPFSHGIEQTPWHYKSTAANIYSSQIVIFQQPRFPWIKGNSLTKPPFGVRSCEVAIIWPGISISGFGCLKLKLKNEIETTNFAKLLYQYYSIFHLMQAAKLKFMGSELQFVWLRSGSNLRVPIFEAKDSRQAHRCQMHRVIQHGEIVIQCSQSSQKR